MTESKLTSIELAALTKRGLTDVRLDNLPERPRIAELIHSMCQEAKVKTPDIYVCTYPRPNIFFLGKDKVFISQIMLDILKDDEVAALAGHELGHAVHKVKHKIMDSLTVPLAITGAIVGLKSADLLTPEKRIERKNQDSEKEDTRIENRVMSRRRFLARTALGGAGAYAGWQASGVVHQWKEDEADKEGAKFSHNPEALISALRKCDAWDEEHEKTNKENTGIIGRLFARKTYRSTDGRADLLGVKGR